MNAGTDKSHAKSGSRFQHEESGEYPCSVCRKGVASNSIRCVECLR